MTRIKFKAPFSTAAVQPFSFGGALCPDVQKRRAQSFYQNYDLFILAPMDTTRLFGRGPTGKYCALCTFHHRLSLMHRQIALSYNVRYVAGENVTVLCSDRFREFIPWFSAPRICSATMMKCENTAHG